MFVRQNGNPSLVAQHRNTVSCLGASHRPTHQLLPANLPSELTALRIRDGHPAPCDGLTGIEFKVSDFRQAENSVQVALDSLCQCFMSVFHSRGFQLPNFP